MLLGAFFVVNLFLAVIFDSFYSAQLAQVEEAERRKQRATEAFVEHERTIRDQRGDSCLSEASLASDSTIGPPPPLPPACPLSRPARPRLPLARVAGSIGSTGGRRFSAYVSHAAAERVRGLSERASREVHASSLLHLKARCIERVVEHVWFDRVFMALIIMNTVALALYYKDMPAQLLASLESVNLVLTIAFTVELLLKLAGHGVAPFCGEPHNVFDALIVVTSLLEVVVSYSPHIDIGIPFSVPSTFEIIATPPRLPLMADASLRGHHHRCCARSVSSASSSSRHRCRDCGRCPRLHYRLRNSRVIRLARWLSALRQIVATVAASIHQIANLFFILFLVMFIFALLGMEIFKGRCATQRARQRRARCASLSARVALIDSTCGRYTEANGFDPPVITAGGYYMPAVPYHFENFPLAMVTIFVVVSGENWNDVYFEAFKASPALANLYFIALVIIGNYMVLNLFIAILLGNFEPEHREPADHNGRRPGVRRLVLKFRGASVLAPLRPLLFSRDDDAKPSGQVAKPNTPVQPAVRPAAGTAAAGAAAATEAASIAAASAAAGGGLRSGAADGRRRVSIDAQLREASSKCEALRSQERSGTASLQSDMQEAPKPLPSPRAAETRPSLLEASTSTSLAGKGGRRGRRGSALLLAAVGGDGGTHFNQTSELVEAGLSQDGRAAAGAAAWSGGAMEQALRSPEGVAALRAFCARDCNSTNLEFLLAVRELP